MQPDDVFGSWLRQQRKILDLTQAELAQQLDCATVTVKKIEAGVRRPSKQIADRLATLLAIEPATQATFVTFARGLSSAPPATVPGGASSSQHLPSLPTPFIGRDRELVQLQRLLDNSESRLVTIVGPGGIGKTRLAVEAASRSSSNFADGAYFVSLAAVTSPDLLLWAIGETLEGSVVGSEAPLAQLITALRDQNLLLVLDNFEHLVDDGPTLAHLLAGAPHLKILVTSRARLNLQGEWVLPLLGFDVPVSAAANDDVESYPAVQLFLQSAQRVQPDFALSGNVQAVMSICQLVEGMPLAIELAATWVRLLPCAQIAEQLSSSLDFLASPLRDAPERHRSLRAVFDHSWSLLSPAEQTALAKLSVFRGTFDLEAANEVAAAPLPVLASLSDKSLLQANGKGKYALHDLLRHYAAEKLATQVDAASHQERAITYLNTEAERASNADDQRQAADYVGQAIAIAEDAGKSALLVELHQKRGDLVIAAMVKLGGVLTNDGNLEEAVDLYERGLARGGNANGDTHNGLGRTLYWLGRYHDAVAHLRRAVELQQGDPINQIFPLQDLGLALAATGAYTEAVSVFGQAQRLSREYEDWPLLARSVANSAGFHLDVFDYAGNQALAEEARALARLADFVLAEVSAGLDLLFNFARRQEIGRAAKLMDEVAGAVENAQGTHGWLWRLRFTQACAEIALARGGFDESQRLASTALQEGHEIGRVKYQVLALKTRAQALVAQGDTAAALVDLRNALNITRPTTDPALFFQVASVLLTLESDDALAQETYATAARIRAALPSDEMRQIFAAAEPVRQVARLVE